MTTLQQYPMVRPRPGLVFQAYVSRKDIGSGVRLFVVARAGRKYIHLFYHPQLVTIVLSHREWATLHMAPISVFDQKAFKARVTERARSFDHLGIRYNARDVGHVLKLDMFHGARNFGGRSHVHT